MSVVKKVGCKILVCEHVLDNNRGFRLCPNRKKWPHHEICDIRTLKVSSASDNLRIKADITRFTFCGTRDLKECTTLKNNQHLNSRSKVIHFQMLFDAFLIDNDLSWCTLFKRRGSVAIVRLYITHTYMSPLILLFQLRFRTGRETGGMILKCLKGPIFVGWISGMIRERSVTMYQNFLLTAGVAVCQCPWINNLLFSR